MGRAPARGTARCISAYNRLVARAILRRMPRRTASSILAVVVDSLSVPGIDRDRAERPPNERQRLVEATGMPNDRDGCAARGQLRGIVTIVPT